MAIKVIKRGKGYGVYFKPTAGRKELIKSFKTKSSANTFARKRKKLAKKAQNILKDLGVFR